MTPPGPFLTRTCPVISLPAFTTYMLSFFLIIFVPVKEENYGKELFRDSRREFECFP
jgi:hypothetical protein